MRRLTSIAMCAGVGLAGLVGGLSGAAQGPSATALQAPAPAPVAPADTAALRGQYEQWRKDFKTWGKWAPVGQESKGTTSLITPEKVQSALKLVKSGIVVSLAHAEPQEVAADVGAAGLFHRVDEWHHRRRHDRQLSGQLSRPDRGAHRQLVPLLRERPDVQRRARAGTT